MNNKEGVTKIQHFVPQFFQRYFSYNNDGKTIGMFNVNNNIFQASTPIRTQSYGNFFYGKSGDLETWLSELESKSAPIFRVMWEREQLPTCESTTQLEMLHFLLVLDLRNPVRFNTLKNFEKIIQNTKSRITGNNVPTDLITVFQHLQSERGKLTSLINAVAIVPDLIDLKYKLIKNVTNTPLIISDNPLVIYNQFLEKRKWNFVSQRGYGSKGLQMFLPVNDKYILVVYDSEVYKIGNKKEKIVEVDNKESIDQLNILQFLNSTDTINFNHRASEHYIRTLFEKSKRFKKANEAFVNVHHIDDGKGGVKPFEEAIEVGVTDLKTNLCVQKINFISKSIAIKLDDSFAQHRKGVKLGDIGVFKTISINNRDIK
ncbi:hypothetical protein GGR22_000739 [Flavobacterium gossypii]|uniref:DUF4238 domain-containing protein n=1 Tax=Flavobacterium gossypii TaxID=1646119 RepID=A0ABR6DLR5_9FLAO|nr:DUF4238 domain-containing protein [Flavobacterium gossypii]MBA9072613.1 hypothetical protein [Flavobacterium gossypii]